VKSRPKSTTSERQLSMALTAAGRPVSLEELSAWRKDGLLPPMSSTGLGTGKGKSYYWGEENILARGKTVYDAMHRHGRADQTLVTLFLSGFNVPLPQLRRAWLHRVKLRKAPVVRIVRKEYDIGTPMDLDADNLLLQAALCAGAALVIDAPEPSSMTALLNRAFSKLGLTRHGANDSGLADQLWHLLGIIGSVLDTSDLIREARDDELRTAQHHLGTAMALLGGCSDASDMLGEILAPQLFLFFLTLLRSGRADTLDRIMAYVGDASWQAPAQAIRNLALAVQA
jgi:hypothetical protein